MYVLPHIIMLLNQLMSYNPHVNWLMQGFFLWQSVISGWMDGHPSQMDGHVKIWYNLLYNKTQKPSVFRWPGECGRKKEEWEFTDHACSYYKLRNNRSLFQQMLGVQFEAWGREGRLFEGILGWFDSCIRFMSCPWAGFLSWVLTAHWPRVASRQGRGACCTSSQRKQLF